MSSAAGRRRPDLAGRRRSSEIAQLAAFVALLPTATGGVAHAHHSQAPFFDQSRDVEIEGSVQRFDFRNPHAILYVEVANGNGGIDVWELQFASATILVRAGVSASSFLPGETIRAIGHPSRNADARGIASVAVTKADGTEIVDPLRSGEFAGASR